jgi:RNA-directed DNA polymerase
MSQLDALRSAKSIDDIATLLGYKARSLSYMLYVKNKANRYESFEIPKKSGGNRKIHAPSEDLKLLQRRLSDFLQNCLDQSDLAAKRQKIDTISNGFKRQRSIIDNAQHHRAKRYVFNVDIHDFFGSINFGRIRGLFIKDHDFRLDPKIATIIAQIASHENQLPQGSPCSPVISNLIGHVLDIHLVRLASRFGCVYSRYADDLTFSTNKKSFPKEIAQKTAELHDWVPGNELLHLIRLSGFELNSKKTRMQYCDSRQEVTGLVVNKKVNIRSEYRKNVRAMAHRLFTTGSFELSGLSAKGNGDAVNPKIAGTLHQLQGMLGFIDFIDLNKKPQATETKSNKIKPTSKETLYRRFLIYKEFYSAKTPVILCEGKTDPIYLVHAIRSLAEHYPTLASKDNNGNVKLEIRIFKYAGTNSGRVLGINGGSGDLKFFIPRYHSEIGGFKAAGKIHPIIMLIDNDKGAPPILSAVRAITKRTIQEHELSMHVTGNLYLMKTPLINQKPMTCIEDFFTEELRRIAVNGKNFSAEADFDVSTHYGKMVFAHKVVVPNAQIIDFSGFKPILSALQEVVAEHYKKG